MPPVLAIWLIQKEIPTQLSMSQQSFDFCKLISYQIKKPINSDAFLTIEE